MNLPITSLFAGILALFLVPLSLNVGRQRLRARVGIFDGGDKKLGRAIRVQGNFIEYVPLALVLFALIELNGGAAWWLYGLGVVLVVARLLHAYGLSRSEGASRPRAIGIAGTLSVITAAGLTSLYQFAVG